MICSVSSSPPKQLKDTEAGCSIQNLSSCAVSHSMSLILTQSLKVFHSGNCLLC